jgi:hypothetical protein
VIPRGGYIDAQVSISDGINASFWTSADGGATWAPITCAAGQWRYSWDCSVAGATNFKLQATPDPSNPGGLAIDGILN